MGLSMVYLPAAGAVGIMTGRSPFAAAAYAVVGVIVLRIILSLRFLLPLAARRWRDLEDRLHLHQHYKIPRYNENSQENPLYRKAASYISSLPSLEDSDYVNIFSTASAAKKAGADRLFLRLEPGRSMRDSFLGARIAWTNVADAALVLSVRLEDKRRVLRPYLNHVESVADELDQARPELRLYTNCAGESWSSVPFSHPATLETFAMDADLKNRIRGDLDSFLKNKAYYHRLGRVWKRSYLLYGAPGTGKSSFAAAMAKFLRYDVYELDLGRVREAGELRALLLRTNPRSVIVVENVDRYLQEETFFSGMLGFMDGIFSCCGEERVVVFTMNGRKEEMEGTALRPGRVDVHVHFPLCDFSAFKTMAGSYLGLKEHKLYPQVEEMFQAGATLSHAEIGEIMIANRGSPSRAIKTVIGAMQQQHQVQQQQQQLGGAAGRMGAAILGRIGAGGGMGRWRTGAAPPAEDEGDLHNADRSEPLKESTLKDFRKFYGLLKMRGGSRKEANESPSVDPSGGGSGGEKEPHSDHP